ncbi:MAG: hypothetical protein Q8P12_07120 [bacterium]|nr:hypothetical protein [bacterium]
MASVEEIQALYDQGKLPEAMSAVWREVVEERQPDDPDIPELCAIRAWCHYRRREWDNVREWIAKAGDTLRAKRLRAYMAAYVDKDDATLQQIAQELSDDVGVQNALVIRARDAESSAVSVDELNPVLIPFVRSKEVDAANLFHNAARLMLAKGSSDLHLHEALVLIDGALERYGTQMHWHHRAAATFWRSHMLERLGRTEEARGTIAASVGLWEKALELDPSNQGFQTNLENARKRATEL